MILRLLAGLIAALAAAWPAAAHNLPYSLATLKLDARGGYEITLNCHTAALILGQPQGHLSAPAQAQLAALSDADVAARAGTMAAFMREATDLRADGRAIATPAPDFPTAAAIRRDGAMTAQTAAPSDPIRITGRLPWRARSLDVSFPLELGTVLLRVEEPDGKVGVQALTPGERSQPVAVSGAGAGPLQTAFQYLRLGFEHITPKGLDHILFVLALFLLTPRWKPLAAQVTAFTLAHSVTLALAVFGLIALPARLVESAIALSIAVVAFDNLFEQKLARWRAGVVFAFGLLHGMGFAGVLARLGLPKGAEALALVSFNVGIELGQLSVLVLAFAALGWTLGHSWRRKWVTLPLSFIIGAAGLFWTVERAFFQT